ncbi:hypothetical protein [Pseudorhodoplanes sp.]|uniref:hypothetical protein n=1 Tax=Pseudorhodoplanes sp. TaxID=1934341 RepID=UPI003D0F15CB
MQSRFRTAAVVRLDREQAIDVLEQSISAARALGVTVPLIRPQALAAVMAADPRLIEWSRCSDGQYRPVYRAMTFEVSERLYAHRQEKRLGGITRELRAAPDFGRRV